MAGKVTANTLQLGDSATATQNFVLQTNVDGSAKLARGNAGATTQDILSISSGGVVTANQGLAGNGSALTSLPNSVGIGSLTAPSTFPYLSTGVPSLNAYHHIATYYSGKISLMPAIIGKTIVTNALVVNVVTLVAGKTIRVGIYSDNGNGYPGSLLVDAGTASFATTGIKEISVSQTLTPGIYWLAFITDSTATGAVTASQSYVPTCALIPAAVNDASCGYQGTQAYGALPSTLPALTGAGFGYTGWVGIKVA